MKVTFILKDLTDTFFVGNANSVPVTSVMYIVGLNTLTDYYKFYHLKGKAARKELKITMKVGHSDSFRDKVDLNHILHKKPEDIKIKYKLEPRRGYKLATFEIE
jgi:hypothetical protein